jgi:hypothetical protein
MTTTEREVASGNGAGTASPASVGPCTWMRAALMRQELAAVSVLVVAGVNHAGEPMTPEAVVSAAREGVTFVDNDHIMARQAANPDLLLLDVRAESEFTSGRIPGAAWGEGSDDQCPRLSFQVACMAD